MTLEEFVNNHDGYDVWLNSLNIRKIKKTHSCEITSLKGIEKFKNITWLCISDTNLDKDSLKYISELSELRQIYMNNIDIDNIDISVLSKCTNLLTISIYNTPISDIPFINNLPKLKSINIFDTNMPKSLIDLKFEDLKHHYKRLEYLNNLTT